MYYCDEHRPALIEKARKNGKVEIGKIAKILGEGGGKCKTKDKNNYDIPNLLLSHKFERFEEVVIRD